MREDDWGAKPRTAGCARVSTPPDPTLVLRHDWVGTRPRRDASASVGVSPLAPEFGSVAPPSSPEITGTPSDMPSSVFEALVTQWMAILRADYMTRHEVRSARVHDRAVLGIAARGAPAAAGVPVHIDQDDQGATGREPG
jgi:hypothetical protein